MKPFLLFCILTMSLPAALSRGAMAQGAVQKTAEPFESVTWKASDDNTAAGIVALSPDVPPDLAGVSKHSLDLAPSFSGSGFEFFQAAPVRPLVIPGITKKVSLWVRNDPKYVWVLQFKDGWGRSQVGDKKLEWPLNTGATPGGWKKVSFDVPPDWVQPISIVGAFVHNWDSQTVKGTTHLGLDQLEVETDISGVDETTGVLKTWTPPTGQEAVPKAPVTPLLTVSLAATEMHNVFCGVKPAFVLTAQNWYAATAEGKVAWKITDPVGVVVKSGSEELHVADHLEVPLPLDTPKYGVYRLDATVTWADGRKIPTSQTYAVIPVPRELTDAEKDASPYGLNVLSARQPMVATFRKAGIVWFRDYGFNYDWMVRAKGTDNKYAGWPYYPKIVRDYDANGARVVANLQTAIRPPTPGAAPGPDRAWTKELAGILLAFPSIRAFELDNEYDLNGAHAKAEDAIDWKNYGLYHKKFGEVAQLLGDGQIITVENGRAGIWPERERRMVQSGDFATIDVINSHHYAGADPPELNVVNYNMGFAGNETPMSFFDQLRAAKKAGDSDGKPRQHWLTEFGWDTKAGPIVSPAEQAAYLARAYMLLSAAGTAKGFWYWDLDSAVANQFFDGCGLFTADQMPKLSYAAYAGLTQILPQPEYIGTLSAGENTWGYLFREDGKLVASLWTLDGKPGPKVDFGSARVYDSFANPLPGSTVSLGLAPVYAVGVSENSRWFRQAAYHLDTPYFLSVTAGNTVSVSVQVKNARAAAINGAIRLQLPTGWTDVSGEAPVVVPPNQSASVPLTFRISTDEPLGEKTVRLAISEGDLLQTIPVRVQIQRPITMTVRGLQGEPGRSDVHVRITNHSAKPLDGTLRFHLPASWGTPTPEIKVDALKPREEREVSAPVTWNADWKTGETAAVEYRSSDGRSVQQSLIPSRLTISHAPDLVMDGNLQDWPAKAELPGWVLGSTQGDPNARVYLAWSSKGLYIGADVRDSKATVPDPRSFWLGDVLEVFLDTRDKKTPRKYEPGDHQFWLAPQVNAKRVYVGQWKRGDEIPDTRYDLPGIQSAVVRKADGYVMECLIPASLLQGFKPIAGTRLGLSLNLTVKGVQQDREVFWTTPKAESADLPATWGTVILAP